ncbi:MAG: SDR family NAD(P)-dependent oxidoreductase [Chloroflexota bacterium]
MNSADRAIAIVGVGAILPDAPSAAAFWNNVVGKHYSITETPPDRWSVADYYDPDPKAPDKTYTKIGAWVQGFAFDWKRFRMPPKVAESMDEAQQWAVTIAADALADYGYPERPLDTERTGVILGTAMGGELHYTTSQRIFFPEYVRWLRNTPEFHKLSPAAQMALVEQFHEALQQDIPPITEDSMPGELANIVSGRVANILNLRGPNYITDAACASSFAAVEAAVQLLTEHKVDAVLTGGVDRNMGVNSFVKFCKIGALSATGTRPFGDGADGFVMGEGAGAFLLKRLDDAERAGDTIYAVIRGVAGSSDGKGKGITAPNPIGQQLAVQRAWADAELDPATATLVEAHGTSTRVGDVVEVESLATMFNGAPRGSIGLGSAKSNIGHLKAGAGAAGLLKATLALHHKIMPPTLNADPTNPNIDFKNTPFFPIHEAREWTKTNGTPRRAGVSAYGFGGTNFHLVLEEHIPGMLTRQNKQYTGASAGNRGQSPTEASVTPPVSDQRPNPVRGILALGANSPDELKTKLDEVTARAEAGWTPPFALPKSVDIRANERLVIDFGDHDELLDRLRKARKVMGFDTPQAWKAMEAQGIFRGSGPRPGKLGFLFPGQGSQYVNMGRELAAFYPIVQETLDEADRIMTPVLGRPLSSYLFIDTDDKNAVSQANFDLMQTEITQPAMLTLDEAMRRLLAQFGFEPDVVMGHSLGEYGALVAAGIMPFEESLEAAAGRGREMSRVKMDDNGWMAAVLAPYEVVEATLAEVDGYVVPANINSTTQSVIGGESQAVEAAIKLFQERGYQAMQLPVSHAFHTRIVAPASKPLRTMLDRMHITPPRLPLVANVTGEFYPLDVEAIKDMLEQQIASPVQWVKGLQTMYAAGVRTFVEVGPKRALRGFVKDVFGDHDDVVALLTNHPKGGELPTFNQALCGLYAAGYGAEEEPAAARRTEMNLMATAATTTADNGSDMNNNLQTTPTAPALDALAQALAQVLQTNGQAAHRRVYDRNETPLGSVVISGTGLGLPGVDKLVMAPDNAQRILRGEQFVDLIPERFRNLMVDKQVTRLVKSEDGSGRFETISDTADVIKLAGRPGPFDLAEEYGVPSELIEALDVTSQLAMAAGIDALREAGIPLVQTYKRTTTGKHLPDRWLLPEAMRDDTGVIFASAFPGGDRFANEFKRYYAFVNRKQQLEMLEDLRNYTTDSAAQSEINRRIAALREELEHEPYLFDRRFLFRILAMGHSQFAQYIGARGPNTQVNAACASTAQGISIAEDWIRSGRCRRVVVIGADDVTGENLMEWVGAGFLAVGAATTRDQVAEAALPFDRRRHGTIMGMGACALVVESEDAVRERGMRGIVELLSSETNNSAFHGTRLDVDHIAMIMNSLVTAAERRFGINRHAIASQTVFMSHETYTPARGGSASAEVTALRHTFGEAANNIIIANTKGFTGHPMGVGVEDVIAVKILEYGIVPPVPNFREVDPELGLLNLSRGGHYPVQYAIHLAAGFGSQISLTFTRRIPGGLDRVDNKPLYQRWLADVSGYDTAETEVVKHVLRVVSAGNPPRPPMPNRWQPGTGPTIRAASSGEVGTVDSPARMVNVPPAGNGRPAATPAPSMPVAPAGPTPKPEPSLPTATPQPAPVASVEEKLPAAGDRQPTADDRPQTATPAMVNAPSPVVASTPALDPVAGKVLQIVAEQTGYPQDMLDLDLDMEADLGIDTVKQAETFLAIRQAFDIPRRDDMKLRDYPTLGAVIGFVRDNRPDLAQPVAVPPLQMQANGAGSAVAAPPAATAAAGDPIADKVLQIVAEQTGYPQDMLELDLDMEADLGIDTVKQAETFLAIRQAFDIPRRDDMKLRDYPTLGAVIGFVRDNRPDLARPTTDDRPQTTESNPQAATPVLVSGPSSIASFPTYTLADADAIPRRIPVPSLRPSLDLCKPTGVTLDGDSRVVVMLDRGGVGKALVSRLEKLGATALVIDEPPTTEALEAQLQSWLTGGPIQGVYWLTSLDVEPELGEMTLETWRENNRARVKNLYVTMRALYESVNKPGTFLVSATRLGGLHGYGPQGATAPMGGAVSGFTKAYKRERGDALVKVVDFEAGRKTATPAEALIAETLSDPGIVEVGYYQDNRYTITLIEESAADGQPGLALGSESVYLVTGAAGGITSAIIGDLALAGGGGTFYLLDLVPEPARDDKQIALFRQGKDTLKQHLIATAKAAGEKATPAQIDKQVMTVERNEAALRAIESVEAAGGTAHYRSVNLLDGAALTAIVDEIRDTFGRIDVLVHAGGVEISRSLPDKDNNQFSLVFDIKADGFFSLLRAASAMPIGATVAFSSVAGRFGNNGQTDYSAANDLLCKLTSHLRQWRPDTKGIVIDWTAWGEIGMATRGSIPKIMEMAGIDMLPPSAGIPTVRRELVAGSYRGEIVVGGRLGILADEWDETGGLDVTKANEWLAQQPLPLHMLGRITAAKLYGGLEVETVLDPNAQPFLYDHAMEGTPLLPGVMGTEAFGQLAKALAPGYQVAAVFDEQFHAPFKFYRMENQTLYLNAIATPVATPLGDNELVVRASLRSMRDLGKPGLPPQEKLHFTGKVRMTQQLPQPVIDFTPPAANELPIESDAVYRVYFHGPAYQVLERADVRGDTAIGLMTAGLPPNTSPAETASVMAPRLIELCFQTAGVWDIQTTGTMALPLGLESVTTYKQPAEANGHRLYSLVTAQDDGAAYHAKVVDETGAVYVDLKGYRTVALPGNVSLK